MTDVYLPLPYIKKNLSLNEEPRILLKLGVIYKKLRIGKQYQLTNPVNFEELSGTYFNVMVTDSYDGKFLVQPESTKIINIVEENFFSLNNPQDYRTLSKEEYYSLYPKEELVLPGRCLT